VVESIGSWLEAVSCSGEWVDIVPPAYRNTGFFQEEEARFRVTTEQVSVHAPPLLPRTSVHQRTLQLFAGAMFKVRSRNRRTGGC
jgi:hypothetical protein